jgi:hypothetical protein
MRPSILTVRETFMKKKLVIAASVLLASVVSAAAASVGGLYQVQGTNPDGSLYSGKAEITPTSETTCRIVWHTGNTASSGICMQSGSSFAAGYASGETVGLVIYEIQDDGSLEGNWTIADQDGVGQERLIPQR